MLRLCLLPILTTVTVDVTVDDDADIEGTINVIWYGAYDECMI